LYCVYTALYSPGINHDKATILVDFCNVITEQIHIDLLGSVLIKITKIYSERFSVGCNLFLTCAFTLART